MVLLCLWELHVIHTCLYLLSKWPLLLFVRRKHIDNLVDLATETINITKQLTNLSPAASTSHYHHIWNKQLEEQPALPLHSPPRCASHYTARAASLPLRADKWLTSLQLCFSIINWEIKLWWYWPSFSVHAGSISYHYTQPACFISVATQNMATSAFECEAIEARLIRLITEHGGSSAFPTPNTHGSMNLSWWLL